MIERLVRVMLAFVELMEAESQRLALGARKLLATGAIVIIGALVAGGALMVGSAFLLWSCYAALLPHLGVPLAALTVGLSIWIVIGGGTWLALRKMRQKRTPAS